MSSTRRRLLVVPAATVLVALTALAYRGAAGARDGFPPEQDLVFLPRANVLRAMSLGHPEAMADLVFIRTITYFGTQLVAATKDFGWLEAHLDTVAALDPRFRTAYVFGGHAAMYNGKPITNHDVLLSSHFLAAGLKEFPDDWQLAFMLGCNYLFEMKTDDAAQKEAWRRVGSEYIRRAALAGKSGAPPWLPSLAATLMTKEGQLDAALRYLEEAYLTASDDRTRDEVGRLLAAKRKSAFEGLAQVRDTFVAGWQKNFPYAPADFYVLAGEPPSPRLDWRWLAAESATGRLIEASARVGDAERPAPAPTP